MWRTSHKNRIESPNKEPTKYQKENNYVYICEHVRSELKYLSTESDQ